MQPLDACVRFYIHKSNMSHRTHDDSRNSSDTCISTTSFTSSCMLCLGLLTDSKNDGTHANTGSNLLQGKLMAKLREKIEPYATATAAAVPTAAPTATTTNVRANSISKDSPTIVLPNSILVMAHCINCAIEELIIRQQEQIRQEISSLNTTISKSNKQEQIKLQLRQQLLQRQEQFQLIARKYSKTKQKPMCIYNQIKESIRRKV